MKKISALILALFTAGANGQALVNADMVKATPVINRDEAGISSCGLGLVVAAAQGDSKAILYDFSVGLWNTAHGLVKAGSATVNYSNGKGWDFEKAVTRKPGPNLIWLAKRDDSVSIRPLKYVNTKPDGFVLAAAPGADTMELIVMASRGEPMQVSFQYPSDPLHKVIGFRTTMSKDDQQAVLDCFGGLLKRLEAEGKEP